MQLELTPKQAEYVREAHHRWNFAVGAVRSGKSHLAIAYTIPNKVIQLRGKKGLNLVLGSTRDNIERNVIGPMREFWGDRTVSEINGHNIATVAGEKILCIGAEKSNQVARLRGMEVKFCYCDEICDIHSDVFTMLKSRLSLPYSECHAACNPEGPRHYVKQFIDSAVNGVDIYCQTYTLYDNPFLPKEYIHALEIEYAGTVYYDRYILGLWTQAEGLVFPKFSDAIEETWTGRCIDQCVSCDYGTQNAFAAIKWKQDETGIWHAVDEYYYSGAMEHRQKTDADYVDDMLYFCRDMGDRVEFIIDPTASSFITALRRTGKFTVRPANNDVPNGIRITASSMQRGVLKIGNKCENLINELHGYVWDERRASDTPVKVNDHACDALRYFAMTKRLHRRSLYL